MVLLVGASWKQIWLCIEDANTKKERNYCLKFPARAWFLPVYNRDIADKLGQVCTLLRVTETLMTNWVGYVRSGATYKTLVLLRN